MVVGHAPKVQRLGDTLHPFSLFMLCVKNNVTEREQELQLLKNNIASFLLFKLFFNIFLVLLIFVNIKSNVYKF